MNPKGNPQNLKPFKPGDEWTGNTAGRPKKRPITDEYHALSNLVIPEELRKKIPAKARPPKGVTFAQATSLNMWLLSWLRDGHRAAKELREAMEGKAPQRIEMQQGSEIIQTIKLVMEKRLLSLSE